MPGFLSSNLYYKYLNDLINSVREDEFVNASTPGQSTPADSDRSASNSGEGSQTQVALTLTHIFTPAGDITLPADI